MRCLVGFGTGRERCPEPAVNGAVCANHERAFAERIHSPITQEFVEAVRGALPTCVRDEMWRKQALCAEHEINSPEDDIYFTNARRARKLCHGCPVRAECAAVSLAHYEYYGTWGGVSADERSALARMVGVAPSARRIPDRGLVKSGPSDSHWPPTSQNVRLDGGHRRRRRTFGLRVSSHAPGEGAA